MDIDHKDPSASGHAQLHTVHFAPSKFCLLLKKEKRSSPFPPLLLRWFLGHFISREMSYLGVGVSPGSVAVHHGTSLKVMDRRVRLVELVLRCVICGLGVLAAVLVGTDTQVKEIFTIQKRAKFTDMKALV